MKQNVNDFLADVRKYDAIADRKVVGKIVKHLGVALHNRDSATVSCKDQNELDRVRSNWCTKKLGVDDKERCEFVIGKVCETMKAERKKSRVTFYYLVAKHLGKLTDI